MINNNCCFNSWTYLLLYSITFSFNFCSSSFFFFKFFLFFFFLLCLNFLIRREHQQKVSLNGTRSENYRSIEWTKPHVDELFGMYVQEPLSMQCNQSNGYRFPGYKWEGAPVTQASIMTPLKHFEVCENYNPYDVIPLEQGECGYLGECIY